MSTKKLLGLSVTVQNELNEGGLRPRFLVLREMLVMLLKIERTVIEIRDAGLESDLHKTLHRSAKDRERVDRAFAVNREMGKQLSALKKAKKAKKAN